MKKIIVGLFMLFAVCFVTQDLWADCPNKPIDCDYGSIGHQGTCFHVFKGCADCGPKHCPTRITNYKDLHHQVKSTCLSKIGGVRLYGCIGFTAAASPFMFTDVFKAACDESTICYHTDTSKIICDSNFHANMNQLCDSLYPGFYNRVQKTVCKASADAFYLEKHSAPYMKGTYKAAQKWKEKNCPAPVKSKKKKK